MTIYSTYFKTPYGELVIGCFDNKICLCDWRYRKMRNTLDIKLQKMLKASFKEGTTAVIDQTKKELTEYFNKQRTVFTIPLLLVGTTFQKTVWEELLQIPYGKTDSYLGLSEQLSNPKAIRAVASANGANTIAIIIPCHRIIGKNGSLVGYAGGLPTKKALLTLEGALNTAQQSLF